MTKEITRDKKIIKTKLYEISTLLDIPTNWFNSQRLLLTPYLKME